MYELRIERVFRASHALRLYDGVMETPHLHAWRVLVHVQSADLDEIEVVMDFHALEQIVSDALAPLEGTHLNDVEAFAGMNPSAERVAERIYQLIAPPLPDRVKLTRVTVTEAPGCRATFMG
ncbi:MAG: 6-carboxytetrahydropterin synthase [Phycisphaeraceae bacterium]